MLMPAAPPCCYPTCATQLHEGGGLHFLSPGPVMTGDKAWPDANSCKDEVRQGAQQFAGLLHLHMVCNLLLLQALGEPGHDG
jgi:hypothetical protein